MSLDTGLLHAGIEVNAALELVGAGPSACTLLLVQRDRARARHAPDRSVASVVQRVVRDFVDGDVGPHALLVPVGKRVELPDAVARRPLQLGRACTAR